MSQRWRLLWPVALAGVLLALVGMRGVRLFRQPELTIDVDVARWDNPTLASQVEEGVGDWVAQRRGPSVQFAYHDAAPAETVTRFRLGSRAVTMSSTPSAAQLGTVIDLLLTRLGAPSRVFLFRSETPHDRAYARALSTACEARRLRVHGVEVSSRPGASPAMVASSRRDWIVVTPDAAAAHLRELLRLPGRKVLARPPYRTALRRSHPDLWFISPWVPHREYFPDQNLSSCAAARRLRITDGHWPLDSVRLETMAALDALSRASGALVPLQPMPLALIGPSRGGVGGPPRIFGAVASLPRCP